MALRRVYIALVDAKSKKKAHDADEELLGWSRLASGRVRQTFPRMCCQSCAVWHMNAGVKTEVGVKEKRVRSAKTTPIGEHY